VIKEFKEFVLRGNAVDLAVGVVIGAAFGLIVNSLVSEVFNPLIGLLNLPDLRDAAVDLAPKNVPAGDLRYGVVINNVIAFLATAGVVFFFVVKPVNHLRALGQRGVEPANKECPHCLTSIPRQARVCSACTREVSPA
jgi:large conductance mechanosensitive channel